MSEQCTLIGGHGYIGSALGRALLSQGKACRFIDRNTPFPAPREKLGDVFYCAGFTADFGQQPEATIEAHVCRLARLLGHADFRSLVYLSSTRLYDRTSGVAHESDRLVVQPENPRDLYDLSKLLGENLCHVLGQGRSRVVRLASVYGGPGASGFLPDLFSRLALLPPGGRLLLDSSPGFERDYVHLDDVVAGLMAIAESGRQAVYNFASGHNIRNDVLADAIRHVSGYQVHFVGEQSSFSTASVDVSRFFDEFGWRPFSLLDRLPSILES